MVIKEVSKKNPNKHTTPGSQSRISAQTGAKTTALIA